MPLPKYEKFTKRVTVKLTPSMYDRLKDTNDVSKFIRLCIRERLEKENNANT